MGIIICLPISIVAESILSSVVLANVIGKLSKHQYNSHNLWASFGTDIIVYAIFMIIGTVGWRIGDSFNWRLESRVFKDLSRRIYAHLIDQSADFHANRFSGSLVSQTNKFLSGYIRVADTTIYQVISLLSMLVGIVVIMIPRSPLFVVVLVIFSVVYMASGIFVTREVRKYSAIQAASESKQTGYLADSVTNIMAIKSFSGSDFEKSRYHDLADTSRQNTLAVMRASQKQMAYFSILNRIILVLALFLALLGVLKFKANLPTVFLILSYTGSLVSQLWTFCNNSLRNYNRAFGDAQDMTKILQIQPDIKDPVKPEKLKMNKGAIVWENVTFTHKGRDEPIFKALNIDIKSGEKIGLVGHSGSGKTTFTRLLLRFSDVDSGAILIDGQNISSVRQDDLHLSIAYVPQEPIMFHRTLRENIHYGDPAASNEEIIRVSKIAHAHDFIEDLPKGYETLVGERGVKLSGGQRQRIAIARAMLKNAPVLVLDEATSALDSSSEILIQDALWKLMSDRTAIVIAHRLSTIQKMDRIVVMNEGEIVEQGTHKELLAKKGAYAKLWKHQSGGFIVED
jgi:ATP-binding cassette subfamily B protein